MVKRGIKAVTKDEHILPTDLPNFAHGVSGPLKNIKRLHFRDAGIDFNIPLPLALRPERGVDLVVVLDCSNNIHNAPELRKAATWCLTHGYKVPSRAAERIVGTQKEMFTVFNHPYEQGYKAHVPVIMYIPLWKRKEYLNEWDPWGKCTEQYCAKKSENLYYTKDAINKLSGLTRFVMNQNTVKFALKDILYELVNKKPMPAPEHFPGGGPGGMPYHVPSTPGEDTPGSHSGGKGDHTASGGGGSGGHMPGSG